MNSIYDSEIEDYTQAIKINPNHPIFYDSLKHAKEKLDQQ